jgi:glycosyltransferase involved in cell wall biosynthesis
MPDEQTKRSHPLISVIIPTYNRAALLPRAVESVLAQEDVSLELIVVDDGSTDNTGSVLQNLSHSIRYVRIPHAGVSAARNRGIREAVANWIAFLDSDDYWLPGKLKKQLIYLQNESAGFPKHDRYFICHTDEIWIRNGKRLNQGKRHVKYAGWFFIPSLSMCLISPSSVLIHREVFDRVGTFDESFPYVEDYDLWLRITSQYPVGYVDEKLTVKTGGHKDQLSAGIVGIEQYRIISLEKIIASGTLNREFLRAAKNAYRHKAEIYIKGCRKRGKEQEIAALQARMELLLHTPAESPTRHLGVGA